MKEMMIINRKTIIKITWLWYIGDAAADDGHEDHYDDDDDDDDDADDDDDDDDQNKQIHSSVNNRPCNGNNVDNV